MAVVYQGIYSYDSADLGTNAGKKYNGIFSVDTSAETSNELLNDGVSSMDKSVIPAPDPTGE